MKKYILRIAAYILGLHLRPRSVSGNEGKSDYAIVVCSCHPLDSITWHWALYANKPKSIKWLLHPGFYFRTQKLMRRR